MIIPEIEETIKKLSHFSFFGSFAQQRPEVLTGFNNLLNLVAFNNIIEIGTHDGGLSTFFALYSYNSNKPAICDNPNEPVLYKNRTHHKIPKNFHTFDIHIRDKNAIGLIELLGGVFHLEDAFSKNGESVIRDLIQQQGRTLLLCDGGNKINEINTFSKYLKQGDFIMGHDYFRSQKEEALYLSKTWFGKELSLEDIKETLERNSILEHPLLSKIFDPLVWFVGIKNL